MDQKTLEALLAEWQKTLRLQDWDIEIDVARRVDMHRMDVDGQCRWVLCNKSAFIRILDPIDHNPSMIAPCDPERTLVHELLHLHFAPFCELGSETYQHEQAIEAIAEALVTAKRSTPKKASRT